MNARRPLIGITIGSVSGSVPRVGVNQAYVTALQSAGADVLLIPPGASAGLLDILDGFLLPGGGDVDPARYGEVLDGSEGPDVARDELEFDLLARARGRVPVLAVCRGLQVANVALGGTLRQHVDGHLQSGDRGAISHRVSIEPDSAFGQAVAGRETGVNSLHHQAVRLVAPELRVTAVAAEDGVVEGLETEDGMLVAVQCHPEELTAQPWARRLFEGFVGRAGALRPVAKDLRPAAPGRP